MPSIPPVQASQESSVAATEGTQPRSVPYVAYATFESFLGTLKELPDVPQSIAKDMMTGMAGGTKSHLFTALKALNLIDDDAKSQPMLATLVNAYGGPDWKDTLAPFIKESYSDIIGDLDIRSAAQSQLKKCFADQPQSIRDKGMRFYLNALKAAGIEFSPMLTQRKPRSKNGASSGRGKGNRPKKGENNPPPDPSSGEQKTPKGTVRYPLYFKGKPEGSIVVPQELSPADCKVIELQLAVLRAYAGDDDE